MDRSSFLYGKFRDALGFDATSCQDELLRRVSNFATGDDADILVVNGYAGTGKTTALAAIIDVFTSLGIPCVLMAPTGRSAKVLSQYAHKPAHTIHKCIYRQKSVGEDGYGQFSLVPNKARNTLFVVDEVSLIGTDEGQRRSSTSFGTGNLLEDLISFVRAGTDCRLIMVGDSAQLPPVGLESSPALTPGYIDGFGGVVHVALTTVVRQAGESGILRNATYLRELISSSSPDEQFSNVRLKVNGFDDISRVSGAELAETVSSAYARYGEDDTIILCRSNKRAIRYNLGIRSTVQFREEQLVRGDKLMIVKNNYRFAGMLEGTDYIANGDMVKLVKIDHFTSRYGLHFAAARLSFPDYDDQEVTGTVCLDTLCSESASLTYEQQNALYQGVDADYADIKDKRKRYEAVREDKFFNAMQLKYALAVTCHKSQGGQWKCVFIDCPFWQDIQTVEDIKWLYTAITRGVEHVYLVNFDDSFFD